MSTPQTVQVLDVAGPQLALVEGSGRAQAVVWPGVGAHARSMHVIALVGGSRTRVQSHPGEAVYYVFEGSGEVVEPGGSDAQELTVGSMVHVDGGTAYVFAAGDDGLELVGGPSPADPSLYAEGGS
ncbi:MAG TPA: hypothetical protein VGM91_10025 [Conexibacter sp.]|jgi:quercetin dioxygenase-like cupin family protein